jgi:hypothetical protein
VNLSPNLAAALAEAGRHLPPGRIDRVWLFPPRPLGERESGLAVLSVHPPCEAPTEAGRRQVFTLRYEAITECGRTRRTDALEEQAVAPAERLERVIEGVLRRLGAETELPLLRVVGGDPAKWAELLAEGGVVALDSIYQE